MAQCGSFLFLFFIATITAVPFENAQSQTKQKQEQRDNRKVKEAEQELSAAKKKLTDNQRTLRDAIRGLASQQSRLVETKQALRKAESEAERKLGEKLGLPSLFDKTEDIRERLQSQSKPVLEALKLKGEWKQAQADAEKAKIARDAAQEDPELSDMDREKMLEQWSKTISKPNDLEIAAIAADPSCAKIQNELNAALEALESARKKIDQDKVSKDPAVAKLKKELGEIQKNVKESEASVLSARKRTFAAAKDVAESQTKWNRAKQQDKRNDKK